MKKTMKKITTIALLMLMSLGANAQKDVFMKYKGQKGVTIVKVPKMLMRLAGRMDKDVRMLTKRLENIRVLSCEEKAMAQKIKADALSAYKQGGYEEMVKVNDDGEVVSIYHRNRKGGKNEYAILSIDEELSIINVVGHLSLEDLDKVMDLTD